MHAELLDLIFTGTVTGALLVGTGFAMAALPWRERDLRATENAVRRLGIVLARNLDPVVAPQSSYPTRARNVYNRPNRSKPPGLVSWALPVLSVGAEEPPRAA